MSLYAKFRCVSLLACGLGMAFGRENGMEKTGGHERVHTFLMGKEEGREGQDKDRT